MKSMCVVGLLLFVAVVRSQDAAAVEEMQCITGYSVNGRGNFTTERCTMMEKGCQTKIVRNGPLLSIVKRCKEWGVCENNAKNNEQICYGDTAYSNSVHICHFCCDTPNCNTLDDIPDLETERAVEAGATAIEGSG